MAVNAKQYVYEKGLDPALDAEFARAGAYGKVKPGNTAIFWKAGLRWYNLPMEKVQRIFRQREGVLRKLCCGGKSFFIERLVLVLHSGETLVLHIGDDVARDAEALLARLREIHPNLQYGKV